MRNKIKISGFFSYTCLLSLLFLSGCSHECKVEGKLTISMEVNMGATGEMNLIPMITVESSNGTCYQVVTSADTSFINLEKNGNSVSYTLDDNAKYRITGEVQKQDSNKSIRPTLLATRVELLKK